ncbi:Bodo-specific multi-copy gene family, putative [Bodo saltans]|uniref:Bodo-specific multi-copy gene family, putative n=1 Tax=Bodo saltans TaxID=75058 RepID=A0A0S4IS91_BODSA|nr:Bodo-specific multi-copy gene family, putative [Bodo saltans]|eukprot:CUG05417.1 Bodo-specific multi-copy gene family, putative [Bodo saltans]
MAGEERLFPIDDAIDGLCELIRSHVESVTGRYQPKSNYTSRKVAYETWMQETALHFGIRYDMKKMDPLIVLDSCEVLDS